MERSVNVRILLDALGSLPFAVLLTNSDGVIDWVSEEFTTITGYGAEEVRGRNATLLSEQQSTTVQEALQEVVLTRKSWHGKLDCIRKDRRTYNTQTTIIPLRGSAETAPGFVITQKDITAQVIAEAKFLESQKRFRDLFENAPIGIYRTTPAGEIVVVNPPLMRMLGYESLEDVVKRNLEEEGAFEPGYSREAFKRTMEQYGEIHGHEGSWRKPDGSYLQVRESAKAIRNEQGDIVYYDGVIEDITESKRIQQEFKASLAQVHEAHQRLRFYVDTMPLGYFEWDEDFRISEWNPAAERIFGWSAEEVLGKHGSMLFSPESLGSGGTWARMLDRDQSSSLVSENVDKHGRRLFCEWFNKTLRDESGRITRVLSMVHDISERKLLEDKLQQSQKLESLGRMAGGVAHDFNNLLTVINGYCDLILKGLPVGSPMRLQMEQVLKAGVRAAGLTQQLLAFSRKQVMQPKPLDVNAMITEDLDMLHRLMGEDIEVVTRFAPNLGQVMADPGQMQQVLMNLAVNARDAMPEGGMLIIETSKVEVDGTKAADQTDVVPGSYVLLSLTDTGTGMDKETQLNIFEPFFTTKKKGAGTGLGLSMVHGIVRQSGGWISVRSAPGMGTAFKIYLPTIQAREFIEEPALAALPADGSETVLVVEDEQSVRDLVTEILGAHGYHVLSAPNAADALTIAQNHPGMIQMIITDVVMPGMTGLDLAERMAASRPGIKVLFMSGFAEEMFARRGSNRRGLPFISKPFSPTALDKKTS